MSHKGRKEKKDQFKKNLPEQIGCHRCKKLVKREDAVIGTGYWYPLFSIYCGEKCRDDHTRENLIACQKIDSDCNDCKFFERKSGQLQPEPRHTVKRWLFPALDGYPGFCKKYNIETWAHPNYYSGYGCFVHRNEGNNN